MKGLIFSIKTGLKNLQIQANLLKKTRFTSKNMAKNGFPTDFQRIKG